jgi:hypothetical protein
MVSVWKWSSNNDTIQDEKPMLEYVSDLQVQLPLLLLQWQRLMDSVLVWHKTLTPPKQSPYNFVVAKGLLDAMS